METGVIQQRLELLPRKAKLSPAMEETNSQLLAEVAEIFNTIGAVDVFDGKDKFILRSKFNEISAACGNSDFMHSAFWRYLTDEWIPVDRTCQKLRHFSHKKLTFRRFESLWKKLIYDSSANEDSIVFHILLGTHPHLKKLSGESFEPIVEDVVKYHKELQFLAGNHEFVAKYIETVILRIFYGISKSLAPVEADVLSHPNIGISFQEFRQSGFRKIIETLGQIPINDEIHYFSYQHFYVMYCKYFDLGLGDSFRAGLDQLTRYEGNSLNRLACQRVLGGHGFTHQWQAQKDGVFKLRSYCYGIGSLRSAEDSAIDLSDETINPFCRRLKGSMNYMDFVYFILAEEDRSHPAALEYWFRILDTDQDGVLSIYELEQFWEEQEYLLASEGASFDFCDVICVALDLTKRKTSDFEDEAYKKFSRTDEINPQHSPFIITKRDILSDIYASARFLDMFLNWRKVLERETTNGNRLYREIDELQQAYFQRLGFMPSQCANPQAAFSISRIPSDKKNSWARWAEIEYEQYTVQEELEIQKKKLEELSPSVLTSIDSTATNVWIEAVTKGVNEEEAHARRKTELRISRNRRWKKKTTAFKKSFKEETVKLNVSAVAKTLDDLLEEDESIYSADSSEEDMEADEGLFEKESWAGLDPHEFYKPHSPIKSSHCPRSPILGTVSQEQPRLSQHLSPTKKIINDIQESMFRNLSIDEVD